jgi:hypothetical protein
MRDRTHDTPSPSANAFAAPFLDLLDPEDDPLTATEAAAEGPWTVVRVAAPKIPFAEPNRTELTQAEPWAVVREGEAADTAPAATFVHLHTARLAAHLPWHHQELVVTLNHLDALARSPRALAAVLDAAGATALRRVGALLTRRSA